MTPAPETPRHRRTTSAVDDGALRDAREKARDPYTVVQEVSRVEGNADDSSGVFVALRIAVVGL